MSRKLIISEPPKYQSKLNIVMKYALVEDHSYLDTWVAILQMLVTNDLEAVEYDDMSTG